MIIKAWDSFWISVQFRLTKPGLSRQANSLWRTWRNLATDFLWAGEKRWSMWSILQVQGAKGSHRKLRLILTQTYDTVILYLTAPYFVDILLRVSPGVYFTIVYIIMIVLNVLFLCMLRSSTLLNPIYDYCINILRFYRFSVQMYYFVLNMFMFLKFLQCMHVHAYSYNYNITVTLTNCKGVYLIY